MSRFYASISGQAKSEATRRGSPMSGIEGHIRGWNVGVRVQGYVVEDDDAFRVYATSGSNGRSFDVLLGTLTLTGGTTKWEPNRDAEGVL